MWVCSRCYQENADQDAVCGNCGAQRGGGRFQTPARRPVVRAAEAPVPRPTVQPAKVIAEPKAPPVPPPKPRRSPLDRLAAIIGLLLLILLPACVIAFAVRQREALSGALLPFLLDENAAQIAQTAVYLGLSASAALLSATPGIVTLLLARRPLPPPNRRFTRES